MSDTAPTPDDTTDDAAEVEVTEATATEPTDDKPGAEAARYRRRLREAEAQRDTLTATLDTYRRRDVERAAEAAGLARGGDLFDAGAQLADLLAEDGTVDNKKVQEAAAALLVERPHWRAQSPGLDLGVRGEPSTTNKSWSDVLKA